MSFLLFFSLNKGVEAFRRDEEDDYEERFMLWAFYTYYQKNIHPVKFLLTSFYLFFTRKGNTVFLLKEVNPSPDRPIARSTTFFWLKHS